MTEDQADKYFAVFLLSLFAVMLSGFAAIAYEKKLEAETIMKCLERFTPEQCGNLEK